MIIDDLYENRPPRIYSDYAPTLRSERFGLKVLSCASRLRYPNGNPEHKIEVHDEFANCITSISTDSMVLIAEEKNNG